MTALFPRDPLLTLCGLHIDSNDCPGSFRRHASLQRCISSFPCFTICFLHMCAESGIRSSPTGVHLTLVPSRSWHWTNSSDFLQPQV